MSRPKQQKRVLTLFFLYVLNFFQFFFRGGGGGGWGEGVQITNSYGDL